MLQPKKSKLAIKSTLTRTTKPLNDKAKTLPMSEVPSTKKDFVSKLNAVTEKNKTGNIKNTTRSKENRDLINNKNQFIKTKNITEDSYNSRKNIEKSIKSAYERYLKSPYNKID